MTDLQKLMKSMSEKEDGHIVKFIMQTAELFQNSLDEMKAEGLDENVDSVLSLITDKGKLRLIVDNEADDEPN